MISAHIANLFAYNSFVWDSVFRSLDKLDNTTYLAEQPFFWRSLHEVSVHCMSAEWIWLSRCKGESPSGLFDPAGYPDFSSVKTHWLTIRADWDAYLATLTPADYSRPIEYRNTKGNGFTLIQKDILQHVINHATEHRSQMTPTLYNLGVPTVPLDYMSFCVRQSRKRK